MAEPATRDDSGSEQLTVQAGGPPPAVPDSPGAAGAGRYVFHEEIGRGGMGVVYRATDTLLGREVAIKMLQGHLGAGHPAAERFLNEAQVTGQLQHPGIPAVYDLRLLPDGRPFLAMKLIKGHTLEELLDGRPEAATDRGCHLAVFEQVCHAVGYAHAHGVVHRDLKPGNVMVGRFGEVQVMDWGVAKVLSAIPVVVAPPEAHASTEIRTGRDGSSSTQAGSVFGTWAFMPPEQAGGEVERIDQRADVFGLGAILAVILTGQPPYVGPTPDAVRLLAIRGQVGDCLARLDASGAEPELVALCKRCLAFEPADRPADAGEVAREVADFRAAAEQRARAAELEQAKTQAEAREQRKRQRVQLALFAALAVLVVGVCAFAWWSDRQATQNADALDHLLDTAEAALPRGDTRAAADALAAAEPRRAGGLRAGQPDRLERLRRDVEVQANLDRIDQLRWSLSLARPEDLKTGFDRLRAALAPVVPDLAPATLAAAAGTIAQSAIRERLVGGVDWWLRLEPDPANRRALRGLLQAIDPDPYRDRVRDAVLAGDTAGVVALAGEPAALEQHGWFAAYLGDDRAIPAGRRRELLGAALRAQPGNLGLLMAMGGTYPYNRPADAEERVRWYQAAVAAAPTNAAAFNNLGTALADRGDLAAAAAAYEAAIARDAEFAWPHVGLGNVRRRLGDPAGAVVACRKAIRLDGRHPLAHNNLGLALVDQDDLDAALDAYADAARLAPPGFLWPLDNRGFALLRLGEFDQAEKAFQAVFAADPTFASSHNGLGWARLMRGDPAGALAKFDEAVRLDATVALSHNNRGVALRDLGRLDEAVAAYKEAARLDPAARSIAVNLAQAERWRLLRPHVAPIANGEVWPRRPALELDFAGLCGRRGVGRHALAARLAESAFARDASLSADPTTAFRYDAVCIALMAARGLGIDAPADPSERADLRNLALNWLRADLDLWRGRQVNRGPVVRWLTYWLNDPDLDAVRSPSALAALPADERQAWQALWAEVAATRDAARAALRTPGS